MIKFRKGFKYQLVDPWEWTLRHNFHIDHDYYNRYWWISKSEHKIGAFAGCAWNGADFFPDFDWILEGSLCHDILHWSIAIGIIPEYQNDLIDSELESVICRYGDKRIPGWLLRFRGWYVKKATNLVDQIKGDETPVITVPKRK